MKIIAIIPARGGSKGIPMKNLVMLNHRPLLNYTVTASLHSKINRTIVSTENEEISKTAKQLGAEVIKRPQILATDESQIEPVIIQVLEQLKQENYVPDIILLLQNTSPLRSSEHIDSALDFFMRNDYDSVFSGVSSHNMLWEVDDTCVKPLNYNPLKRQNRQDMHNQFIENGAIYITKNNQFNITNCRISGKIGVFQMSEEDSIEIDSLNDLFIAEQILKMRNKK
jgi:N-acylneuraminate cytidylyltransferase